MLVFFEGKPEHLFVPNGGFAWHVGHQRRGRRRFETCKMRTFVLCHANAAAVSFFLFLFFFFFRKFSATLGAHVQLATCASIIVLGMHCCAGRRGVCKSGGSIRC